MKRNGKLTIGIAAFTRRKSTRSNQMYQSFFRTLESYKSLGENATLMIDAQSHYFRYLQSTRRR